MNDPHELGPVVRETLELVSGTSAARAASDLLADRLQGRRLRNQIKVLADAYRMIEEAGLTGRVVPDKTLVPLLQFVGLEDEADVEMIDRWSALLAHSATTESPTATRAFVDILASLEPAEARWIRSMFLGFDEVITPGSADEYTAFQLRWFNLQRLGLIDEAIEAQRIDGGNIEIMPPASGEAEPKRSIRDHSPRGRLFRLSMFGWAFATACEAPAQARPFTEPPKPVRSDEFDF